MTTLENHSMKARKLFRLLAMSPALAFAQADTAKSAPTPVPFAWADWTWLTGNARTKDSPLDSKAFTGEFRLDATYLQDFNNPKDHTLVGSSEQARTFRGLNGDAELQSYLTAFYATIPEFFATTDAAGNNINKMYVGEWNPPRTFGVSFSYKY